MASPRRGAKLTLTYYPVIQNQKGFSPHHPQPTCEVWKSLGKNCSLYPVYKVLYTDYHSSPWPLTPWPKINRVPPLTVHGLHIKFESGWAKTVVAIVPTRSYTQIAKVDLDLWPHDPKSIGFIPHHPRLTCEVWKWLGKNCCRYRAHKGLYTECQSLPWPLTPHDLKSIGFIPHHPRLTCEVWKWLGKNCRCYRAHKVLYTECQSLPWPLTPMTQNQ